MKGMIAGIKRFAIHDGDGIRTTVFFKGCPLRCLWCHNPEAMSTPRQLAFYREKCVSCGACLPVCPTGANRRLADGTVAWDASRCISCSACVGVCLTDARRMFGEEWEVDALAEKLAADKSFFDASGGGVTLSGGECLTQPEFALELMRALRERGVSVDVDTCGFVSPTVLRSTIPLTDCYLYDVKAIDPDVHRACTGQDNRLILDNLGLLSESGCRIEVRYPLVRGYNDGEADKIGAFLAGKPGILRVKVLQYHDMARSAYRALGKPDTMPEVRTSREDVERAASLIRSHGVATICGWED